MCRIVLALAAAAWLLPMPAPPRSQNGYAEILFQYFANDAEAAVARLLKLDHAEIEAGVAAFDDTHAPAVLQGAAAMHTEAALRLRLSRDADAFRYHIDVATALAQFGEPGKALKLRARE